MRLTAIDALVRQRVSAELPHIIEAADPTNPWATIAAKDAVHILWAHATKDTRAATRKALSICDNPVLQSIDLETLPANEALDSGPAHSGDAQLSADSEPSPTDQGLRARILITLFCLSIGLLGLWSRERALLRMQPA